MSFFMPSINIELSPEKQSEIVNKCNSFKKAVKEHSQNKKQKMQQCYHYYMSELLEGDLLPEPSFGEGAQKDAETNRPQIFLPLTRTTIKQLYAQLKLALFPNDSDFFRVFGKDEEAAQLENDLTTAFKWLFKKTNLSEKLSASLLNTLWAGSCATIPGIMDIQRYDWVWNEQRGKYDLYEGETQQLLDVENCNPIDFYPDPAAKSAETSRWVYCQTKRKQDLMDKPSLYYNLDKLDSLATTKGGMRQDKQEDELSLNRANNLQHNFEDIEKHIPYDLYYFPFLDVKNDEGQHYRNIIVGIAGEQTLVRFSPNMMPGGLNPAVFATWMPDVDSPYGTGPAEDILPLQRLSNFVFNASIESLARSGNILALDSDADTSQLSGRSGGAIRTQGDPRASVMQLETGSTELNTLFNSLGLIKAEAQTLAGSQHPYLGMGQLQTAKTATEFSITSEVVDGVLREVVQHLAETFIQPCLERFMYLAADYFKEPITIRIDDAQGTPPLQVDLSVINRLKGRFTMEITSVNLSQSKLAEANTIKEVIQLALASPDIMAMMRDGMVPLIKRYMMLNNMNDADRYLLTAVEQVQNQSSQLAQMLMQVAQSLAQINPEAAQGIQVLVQKLMQTGALNEPGQPTVPAQ